MNQHVTIRDVAAAAGFSVNTVSRALNDKPDVSPATKSRVLEVAHRLGYRPNKLARGLRSNKTQTIGVIVTDIANPFFAAVVKGIEHSVRDQGWSIILGNTEEDPDRELELVRLMLAEQIDGLLITPSQQTEKTLSLLKESHLPFVLLGRHFAAGTADYVVTDDVRGGFLATEYLIKLGHQRIAMINGPLHISSALERLHGYQTALQHYGIKYDEMRVISNALTVNDGYRAAQLLCAQAPEVSAVFAYSDFVAFGVMKGIWDAGRSIPNDLAVVGYDDIEFSPYLEVPLTTVRIPKQQLGKQAAQILLEKIQNGDGSARHEVKLDVELVIRRSTTSVQGGDHSRETLNSKGSGP